MELNRPGSRLVGAVFAAGLTLAPLLALYVYRPARQDTALADERRFLPIFLFKPLARERAPLKPELVPVTTPAPAPAPKLKAPELVAKPVAADKADKSDERPPALEPAPITVVPPTASAAPAAVAPASAALRLDASVIRNAAQAGKTNLQKMAEASGTYIGDKPSSLTEKMEHGTAGSGKSDCLASNPNGSLLSIFVIGYQAVKNKCK